MSKTKTTIYVRGVQTTTTKKTQTIDETKQKRERIRATKITQPH